jgi:hypothetical protein
LRGSVAAVALPDCSARAQLPLRDLGRYGWAEHWEAVFKRFDAIEERLVDVGRALELPNAVTVAAMKAADRGEGLTVGSVEELFEELKRDD